MNIINKKFDLGDGRMIEIETGKLAKQADGSAVVRMNDTMLLATVCAKKEVGEFVDFMPLTVDYQEKYAAMGRFPGGFFKREARPSEHEILIARLVDRALRPLFPDNFHAEVQVQITLISGDKNTMPDQLAALAAASALAVSDIPFNGPVSEVRVSYLDGQYVINTPMQDIERADLDLIVAATEENIMMVEGEMKEVSEDIMLGALKAAHEAIKTQCRVLAELTVEAGKTEKREYCHEVNDEELRQRLHDAVYQKCYDFSKQGIANKHQREEGFEAIKQEFIDANYTEETLTDEVKFMIDRYYHDTEREAMRDMVLNERTRLDGRQLDQIRPLWSEVNYLPSAHGSAIFTRGETQSLSTVTLGTKLDEQIIDGAVIEGTRKFLLHYNFPGFATGEVKGNRGLSRREVGHGHLAWRALKEVLPTSEECPYTIRVVSDILESNGSSSMATVCAGCLALMDAGVKIRKPVAGIAMGLISKGDKWAVLSEAIWTSRCAVPATVSPPARWISRSTASATTFWPRLLSRHVRAASTSSTTSRRPSPSRARTTNPSCPASCRYRFPKILSVPLSARVAKSSRRFRPRPTPSSTLRKRATWALSTSHRRTKRASRPLSSGSRIFAPFLRSVRSTTLLLSASSSLAPSSNSCLAKRA